MRSFWSLVGVASLALALSMPALAQDHGQAGKDDKKPAAKQDKHEGHAKGDAKHDDKKGDHGDAATAGGAKVGSPAPAFTAKGTDGKSYSLADLKDKVVVLEWINRDCPVCKAQAPKMKETAAKLQKLGVVWLAVDSTASHGLTDNTEHAKKDGLSYPILDDAAGTIGKAYGAKATPTMFVINKGTVVYSGSLIPEKEGSRNYVEDAVTEVLASKPVTTSETKAYGCSVKYKKEQ